MYYSVLHSYYIFYIIQTYILEVRQFCFPTSLHLKRSVTERCLPTGSAWFCFNKFCSSNTPTLGFGLSLVSLIMSCSWTIIHQIYLTYFLYCLISCHVIMINYVSVSSLLQQIQKYENDIKWLSRLHPTAMICCHWNQVSSRARQRQSREVEQQAEARGSSLIRPSSQVPTQILSTVQDLSRRSSRSYFCLILEGCYTIFAG